ncbi:MAG: hypothetical protein ACLRFE_01200 [Clostridia bacterium]
MRIIEKLTAKFKKPELKIVTTRNLVDYMINERIMFVPNYNEREYIKARKRTQRQVSKNLER